MHVIFIYIFFPACLNAPTNVIVEPDGLTASSRYSLILTNSIPPRSQEHWSVAACLLSIAC